MDQKLQARLIGATVLVVLAVLLIPELLSGRKTGAPPAEGAAPGARTFTIDLDGPGGPVASQPSTPATTPTPTPRPRPATPTSEPSSPDAATNAAEKTAAPEPQPVAPPPPAEPAARPAPAAEPVKKPIPDAAPQAAAGNGDWVVQVGAFGSADAAGKLVRELEAAGYAARVSPIARSGKTLHRVRVGPDSSRPEAQQLAERLKARGLPATIVASD